MGVATQAAAAACTEPAAAWAGKVVSALDSVMAQTSTHQHGKRAGQERHAARANARQPRTAPHSPRAPGTTRSQALRTPGLGEVPRRKGERSTTPSALPVVS